MKQVIITIFFSLLFMSSAYAIPVQDIEGAWMNRNDSTRTGTYFVYARNYTYVMRVINPDSSRSHAWGGRFSLRNNVIVMNVQGGTLRFRILNISQGIMRVLNLNTGNEVSFRRVF